MGDTIMTDTVVVITGAGPLATLPEIDDGTPIIAADGALDHALAAGLHPTTLVGDLDSVTAAGLAWAESYATIERHPADKNATDTELALALAVELNPTQLVLVGCGDRLDHTIAAVGALGHRSLTSIPRIDAWWDAHRLLVVQGPGRRSVPLALGTTLSLLTLHGEAHGVTLAGVRWPLEGATVQPVSGRGVSNVSTADVVTVTVHDGVATLLIPPTSEELSQP